MIRQNSVCSNTILLCKSILIPVYHMLQKVTSQKLNIDSKYTGVFCKKSGPAVNYKVRLSKDIHQEHCFCLCNCTTIVIHAYMCADHRCSV